MKREQNIQVKIQEKSWMPMIDERDNRQENPGGGGGC